MQGWIKLHRQLMDKAIWIESTPEQKVILVTLLMMANHEGKEWEWKGEKYKVQPGQIITSLPSIAEKCGKGISIQNIRTALKRFEKLGFLTDESTNQNRLITIINWGFYQSSEENLTDELTGNQQATNRQLTANKNDKNVRNIKHSSSDVKEVIDHWNGKGIVVHQETEKLTKAVRRGLSKYSLDLIKLAIDRYSTIYHDNSYYYSHKWTLHKFLTQSNGVPEFLDDGSMWINYRARGDPDDEYIPPLEFYTPDTGG